MHKVKEADYVKRTLKRLNQELSPFKGEVDAPYVRQMWELAVKSSEFSQISRKEEIRREPEKVHATLKNMELGSDHQDAKTITDWAKGAISKDDVKMQNYLIKLYQK